MEGILYHGAPCELDQKLYALLDRVSRLHHPNGLDPVPVDETLSSCYAIQPFR